MPSQTESDQGSLSPELDTLECNPLESTDDIGKLRTQLRNNLASLFLKMNSILHVSEMAIQDIVENLA